MEGKSSIWQQKGDNSCNAGPSMNLPVSNRWSARAKAMTADRKTPIGATSQVMYWEARVEMVDKISVKRMVNQLRYF